MKLKIAFLSFLLRGALLIDQVKGGNIHGSLEAAILESTEEGVDSSQSCLFAINEYLNDEKPYFISNKEFQDDYLDNLLKPSAEDSTELEMCHTQTERLSWFYSRPIWVYV